MRLLLDQNLSERLVDLLSPHGVDAIHVRALDMRSATDAEILDYAAAHDRVVVSQDSDFTVLLAQRRATRPSVVLMRTAHAVTAVEIADMLLANLPALEQDIEGGAIVSMGPEHVRVRRLPLR